MIKFFRKIRQKMLAENKFSKYLLYAIGEIVLVVIGILIALQINNWNEYQKERKSEKLLLSEIRDNLKYDLNDFESNITTLQNKSISSKMILRALDKNIPYHDSLGYYFSYLNAYPHFSSKTNGYNLLQSKGLDIVTNTNLRNKITDLYEDRYQYLLTFEKERIDYNKELLEIAMMPFMGNEKLPLDIMPNSLINKGSSQTLINIGYFRNIRNYSKLKEDLDFQSMIKNVEIWSSALGTIHRSVKEDAIELIKEIENELQN
ncbi:MAG: hypothetical protein JXR07_12095 [Reichenbachiella sp.]